jgi:hypothetical protein
MKRQKLRKGIHGKRVDWVEHHSEAFEGLHIGIMFTDKTYLSMRFNAQIDGGKVRKVF